MKRFVAVLLLVLFVSTQVFPWGPEGHRIVGAIAQSHLEENTKRNIQSLLGNKTLSSLANWADTIRGARDETYDWHFVDIPKAENAFDEPRDCFRPENKHKNDDKDHQNCVVDRIEMFAKVLGDKSASKGDRIEALKFIVHFVGDVHQPFHAIGDFTGGNDIHVVAFGSTTCEGTKKCNLHYEWDSGMIEHTGMAQAAYVTHFGEADKRRASVGERRSSEMDE
jgi:hypothetical protein